MADNVVAIDTTNKREPRVLRTVNVPHFGAGWVPSGHEPMNQQVLDEAADRRAWELELQKRIKAVVQMFEVDEKSGLDMMQVADGFCYMFDSSRVKKNEAGDKTKAEMRAVERASQQTEFDQVEWDRLERTLELLRKSWRKFDTAFACAMLVRNDVHAYTGSRWGSYIPVLQKKTLKAEKRRLMRQAVFAQEMLGLDEKALQRAIRARLEYEDQYVADNDGIDADDHRGGNANDVAANASRQHEQQLAAEGPVRGNRGERVYTSDGSTPARTTRRTRRAVKAETEKTPVDTEKKPG